jgi:putative transposase
LRRSLKYEDIYLRGYEHGRELRQGVGNWFGDYNDYRPHQALGYATPAEVYRAPESHGVGLLRKNGHRNRVIGLVI